MGADGGGEGSCFCYTCGPPHFGGGTLTHGRLPWALDISAEAMTPAVPLSEFTNGIIRNKTGIAVSLATGRGAGVRNQTKAVLQMSQRKRIPSAEKATDDLIKQVLLKSVLFSTKGHLIHLPP